MERSAPDRAPRARSLTAASLALVVPAVLAACAPTALRGPLLLHPAPPSRDGYALEQGALVFTGPEFTVSARPLDYRVVAKEIALSGEPSPFGDGEEAAGRFLFVRLRLENRSARTLVFNPMRASLLAPGEAPLIPVENSDLVMFAGDDLAGAESVARSFRRLCFDGTTTVRALSATERLLVFPAPEEAGKEMTLAIEDLWLGSASFDLRFAFEVFPGT